MSNKIKLIFLSVLFFSGCGQFASNSIENSTEIEALINNGDFDKATKAIKNKIANDSLSVSEIYNLNFQIAKMERIKKDFNKTDTTILSYIKKQYPQVTSKEIEVWEKSKALECMNIDGNKRYFWNAHRNLFRISKEAKAHSEELNGRQSDELDTYLASYIPDVVKEAKSNPSRQIKDTSSFCRFAKPATIKIKYTITVRPEEVPAGEMIRVWMPYPREKNRYTNIELLSTSQPDYIISPDSYSHKSIYMQKLSDSKEPTVFSYELRFTTYNKWYNFSPEDVKPYDTTSDLYKKYTAERSSHVIFTDEIKRITDSIVGDETNPYLKAKKIFCYIADNYPWASAREYSTIDNIPQYVIENHHGDCGQVSLLFITMSRYAGIPAKWQSGWMLHPGEVNLHDWAEAYFEGIGWVPVDQSFGYVESTDPDVRFFYTKGLDAYRYIVNDDFSGEFYPAKIYPRSETVDFQRGEVEWRGENLYFGRWKYNMDVSYE
jgi:Transglutaminase-like enzymes, putative cysteine proteases